MVTVPMSNLRQEYYTLKQDIDAAIQRVIESGQFELGPELEAFERGCTEYFGIKYALGVGSGTAALLQTLLAFGIGDGDEVITVPNTDISTSMVISWAGASIVFVDVDPRTFNMDPAQLEAKITPRTKAIIPVHLFGHPADLDPIFEIAKRHNLIVIEDAALAFGAEYKGKKVGTLGDAGCLSFASGKILGSYGTGGMVISDRPEIAEKVSMLRSYGFGYDVGDGLDIIGGQRATRKVIEGFNDRLDSLQAAVLRAKLPTVEDRIAARRAAAKFYDEHLASLDLETTYEAPDVRHVYRAYSILVENRDEVRQHLTSRGIATQVYYIPLLHLEPVYQKFGLERGSFPVAESIGDRMLNLPVFPEITQEQQEAVVSALEEIVPKRV